jgi:hypothetical protein
MTRPKAPCGHDGEAVIGAYVRCTQGCAKDPFVQPRVQVRKRGLAGHVDYCACKPCIVRRRAVKVVFRTKSGKTQETPWDGISSTITWTSTVRDRLRHWKLVDEDGDVLADGMCDVDIEPGDPIRVDVVDLVPPTKLTVENRGWAQRKKTLRQAAKAFNFGLMPWGNPCGEVWMKDPRQSAMPDNFQPLYGYEGYRGTTIRDIELAALMVENCAKVRVVSPEPGKVVVEILETSTLLQDREEHKLVTDVYRVTRDVVSMGILLDVVTRTPRHHVTEAFTKAALTLPTKYVNRCSPMDLRADIAEDLLKAADRVHKLDLWVFERDGGFDCQASYFHAPTGERHYLRHWIRF